MTLRAIVGVLLGFLLAIAVSGIYAEFGPAGFRTNFLVGLLLFVPVWITATSLVYASKSTQRIYTWLGVLSGIGYLSLWLH